MKLGGAAALLGIVCTCSAASVHEQIESAHQLTARGHYLEAQTILEAACLEAERTADRDFAAALNNLGAVYRQLGRLRDAQRAYERSFALNGAAAATRDIARTLNNLGAVYTDLGELRRAAETLSRAAALDPGLVEVARLNLGLAYMAARQFSEAEEIFRNLPESAAALNNLGALLHKTGRIEESGAALKRAAELWQVELGPDHPQVAVALANLGAVYTTQHQFPEAETCYRDAIRIAEASLPADHLNLAQYRAGYARLLRQLDRKKEARELEELARAASDRHDRENRIGQTVDVRQLKQ
jgi:tetratricopeptide (TPR) repeat protein